jgi:hypothetical protein
MQCTFKGYKCLNEYLMEFINGRIILFPYTYGTFLKAVLHRMSLLLNTHENVCKQNKMFENMLPLYKRFLNVSADILGMHHSL